MSKETTNPAAEPAADLPKGFPPELIPLYDWWKKEGKSTLLMLVVAGAVVGGFYGFRHWRHARAVEASRAYTSATSLADFESATAKYGSSDLGPALKLRMAKAAYDEGRYNEALGLYDKLVGSLPAELADIARVGRAYALEGKGDYAKAGEAFAVFATDAANAKNYLLFTARLGVERCAAAAGDKEALGRLEAIKEEVKDKPAELARVEALIDAVRRYDPADADAGMSLLERANAAQAGLNSEAEAAAAALAPAVSASAPAPAPAEAPAK